MSAHEIVSAEIGSLRGERDQLMQRLNELNLLIEHSEQLLARLGPVQGEVTVPAIAGPRPTVKSLVDEFLHIHPRFGPHDVVAYVQRKLPEAKEHTIRAQLSHAKSRGEADAIRYGEWVSRLIPPKAVEK